MARCPELSVACLRGLGRAPRDLCAERRDTKPVATLSNLQIIAAAQNERNDLLQIQREWNNRLENVLKYATPREEKVSYDRKKRTVEIDRLKEKGYQMIHKEPKLGADNKLIAFLHPKSSNKVLVELCQDKPEE